MKKLMLLLVAALQVASSTRAAMDGGDHPVVTGRDKTTAAGRLDRGTENIPCDETAPLGGTGPIHPGRLWDPKMVAAASKNLGRPWNPMTDTIQPGMHLNKKKEAGDFLAADLTWIGRPDSSTIYKTGSKKHSSKKKSHKHRSGKRRHKKYHDMLRGVREISSEAPITGAAPSCSSQPVTESSDQIAESSNSADTALALVPAKVATKLYLKKWQSMTYEERATIVFDEFHAVLKNMRRYTFKIDPVLRALFISYSDALERMIEEMKVWEMSEHRTFSMNKIVSFCSILYALRLSYQQNKNMQSPQYYHEPLVAARLQPLLEGW